MHIGRKAPTVSLRHRIREAAADLHLRYIDALSGDAQIEAAPTRGGVGRDVQMDLLHSDARRDLDAMDLEIVSSRNLGADLRAGVAGRTDGPESTDVLRGIIPTVPHCGGAIHE